MNSLRDAFELLVDLPPEARADRLRTLDLSESASRDLLAMLDADAGGSSIVDRPVADVIDELRIDEHLTERMLGTTVGSFRILERIGEGGSAVVFRAVRDAGSGSQYVALKMLHAGLLSVNAERRFRREHAFLAQLNHPNIARLIEGGVSDAGIPYLATELVAGDPITVAAGRRRMGLEDRLRLFSRLCRTVGTAHAALIIHRDLKPSNVLVDGSGEIKVLDFGIAKLIHQEKQGDATLTISLTPEYAAPEQFHAGHQTVAVDIYALGILLGELLTGQRVRGRAPSSVVAGTDVPLPDGLPPRPALARLLRGDIDAIVAMATAEEPARRYLSVEALASDVDRVLAAQPVVARPPSAWYRAGRFFARHRASVLFAGALILGIVISLAVAILQWTSALREAANATAQAARADGMRDFMFEAFAEAEPSTPRAGPATVIDVVERALEATTHASGTDTRARLELRTRLAQVLQAQGGLDEARDLLIDIRAEALRTLDDRDELIGQIAIMVAENAMLRGDFAAARAGLDAERQRPAGQPIEQQVELLSLSAVVASKVREQERARSDGREAMALARTSGDSELQRRTLNSLGVVLLSIDELAEAASVFEELLSVYRVRYGAVHRKVASVQAALSRAYRRLGDVARAEQAARAAIEIDRELYEGDDWHTAMHLNALMAVLRSKGDLRGSLDAARESYRINRATLGDEHPETVNAQYSVGAISVLLEDFETAVPLLRDALVRSELQFGKAHRETAVVRANYGFALAMHGETAAGVAELDRAIHDLGALEAPDAEMLAIALEKRILVALQGDAVTDAQHAWQRLEGLVVQTPASSARWTGNVALLQGEVLLAARRISEAMEPLQRAGRAIDAAEAVDPASIVRQRLLLASALLQDGDRNGAMRLAGDARTRMEAMGFVPRRLALLEASLPR